MHIPSWIWFSDLMLWGVALFANGFVWESADINRRFCARYALWSIFFGWTAPLVFIFVAYRGTRSLFKLAELAELPLPRLTLRAKPDARSEGCLSVLGDDPEGRLTESTGP